MVRKTIEHRSGTATLKFFSKDKGFGFVRLSSGEEAIVRTGEMCHNGHIVPGVTHFEVSISSNEKGWSVYGLRCPGCSRRPLDILRDLYGQVVSFQWEGKNFAWEWSEESERTLSSDDLSLLLGEVRPFLKRLREIPKILRRMGFYLLLLGESRRLIKEAFEKLPPVDLVAVEKKAEELDRRVKDMMKEFEARMPPTEMVVGPVYFSYSSDREGDVYESSKVRKDRKRLEDFVSQEEMDQYIHLRDDWDRVRKIRYLSDFVRRMAGDPSRVKIERREDCYGASNYQWRLVIDAESRFSVKVTGPSPEEWATVPTPEEAECFLEKLKNFLEWSVKDYLLCVETYERH